MSIPNQSLSLLEQCAHYDMNYYALITKIAKREPTKEEYEMANEYEGFKSILRDATDRLHRQQTVILDQMYKLNNAFIPARHMRAVQISTGHENTNHNLSYYCDETLSEKDCSHCSRSGSKSVSEHTPDDVGMSADDLKKIGINDDGRGDGSEEVQDEQENNDDEVNSKDEDDDDDEVNSIDDDEEEEAQDEQYFSGDEDEDDDDDAEEQEDDILDIWHHRLETALSVKVKPGNVGCLQPAFRLFEAPHVARWNGKFHDNDIPPMYNPIMGLKKSSPSKIVNCVFDDISLKQSALFRAYKAYVDAATDLQRCEHAMNYGREDDVPVVNNNATRRQPSRSTRNNKRLRDVSSSDDDESSNEDNNSENAIKAVTQYKRRKM